MRRNTAGRVVTGLKLNPETGYHEATGYETPKPVERRGTPGDQRDSLTDDTYLLGYLYGEAPSLRAQILAASHAKPATLGMTAACFANALGKAKGLLPNSRITGLAKHGEDWLLTESLAALARAEARC